MLTYAQKKYLFAIYKLSQNGGEVRSAEVAKIVGVSKASTVKMTAKLTEEGYINKEYYGKISLTESGVKEANSLFTSYLVICDFLSNKVGINNASADTDTVTLITHTTENTIDHLVRYILEN